MSHIAEVLELYAEIGKRLGHMKECEGKGWIVKARINAGMARIHLRRIMDLAEKMDKELGEMD